MRHLTEAEEALIDQRMSPKETNELLLRLSPIVRRVAQHYSTDEEHAQDLVQECLVHIAIKLSRYREQDAGSVEAWARRVGREPLQVVDACGSG